MADAVPDTAPGTASGTASGPDGSGLILHLDGFDGPLDLLLDLARAQKVDLARISILSLVEQYLAIVEGAHQVRLELAADWLVMAAWLAWLKSRLLLPQSPDEAEEGELAAEQLADRLAQLLLIRAAASWLDERPQLGRDVFARGEPEEMTEVDRSGLKLDVPALSRAYLAALRRQFAQRRYAPRPMTLWSVADALSRLGRLLGKVPSWTTLEGFLPPGLRDPLQRRAAMASTLLAGLEMARSGALLLRQDSSFGPVLLRQAPEGQETVP